MAAGERQSFFLMRRSRRVRPIKQISDSAGGVGYICYVRRAVYGERGKNCASGEMFTRGNFKEALAGELGMLIGWVQCRCDWVECGGSKIDFS